MPEQLTPHFTLEELIRSQEAIDKKLDNTPRAQEKLKLKILCEKLLEPIRILVDDPLKISSGYRSPAVNVAAGGADTSQHLLAEAADFTFKTVGLKEAYIKIAKSNIPYDQLIYEYGRWIHASYGPRNRRQLLHCKTVGGKRTYLPINLKDIDKYSFT